MLKYIAAFLIFFMPSSAAFARTNAEIGRQLYATANAVKKVSPARAEKMKEDIASFLIDINMLNFNENNANWKKLPSGYLYDAKSVQHVYLRHIGVYKSPDGKMMGIFDMNCEDVNDVQERVYGYVKTIDVYFSTTYKTKNGHSKGFAQTFCK